MMRHRGPISPWKTHPHTGALLRPVGHRRNGSPIWPVMGASPDDDGGDGSDQGGAGDSGAGGGADGGDGGDSGAADKDVVSKADLDAALRRMEAADRRASEAEKRLKQIEDAKKDDLTKATERVEEAEKQISDLQAQVRSLTLDKAFLSIKDGPAWHDPATALDLADRKGYLDGVLSDSGEVDTKGLKAALERLAKEMAYLVDDGKKKDDEPGSPSGQPAGGRSDNLKDDRAKREQMRRRFPSIR